MIRNRREFLLEIGRMGATIAAFGGLRSVGAQAVSRPRNATESNEPVAATELRDGLLQVTGTGGNVLMRAGSDGVLLVDSGSSARAQQLKDLIAARHGGAPVRLLFNTHWHVSHTGGNDLFGQAHPTIVAHENTRLWMSTKFYVDWQDRRYAPRAPEARPNKTFFSSDPQPLEMSFGGKRVVYSYLRGAHTDGDIYVWFPESNVIAAGGAAVAGRYPILDYITGGWIGGLVDATKTLIDMSDAETLIVPASGPVQRRDDLELQHKMLSTVRERIEAMANKGMGIDDIIAAGITKEFDAKFGKDVDLFITNIYRGIWWGGRLRGAAA